MELKTYQRQVTADLNRYLELLGETRDYIASFRSFGRRRAPTLGIYQDVLPGVPNPCFVGAHWRRKTFLPATPSVRYLTHCLSPRTKAVVAGAVRCDSHRQSKP